MLENERQISQATSSLMAEERLVDEVEAALSVSLARIADILSSLPAKKDAPPAVRRKELERVRTLIAYCKRKGSLVLAEQADPELDCDRIRLIASELAGDLRAVGIDCAAVVDLAHPITVRDAVSAGAQAAARAQGLRLRCVRMDRRSGARGRPSAPAPRGPGGCCRRGRSCSRTTDRKLPGPPPRSPRPCNVGVAGSSFPIG